MRKILFGITLIAVLLFVFFAYVLLTNLTKPSVPDDETPFPTQSQSRPPTPTSPPLVEGDPLVEQIIDRLPVSTEDYDIEYLSEPNKYIVTIKRSPLEENKKRAQQWFLDNGFSSIDGLNILYTSYPWVEK